MSFFEELKRRNVVRVGVAYAVAAWIILQATDVIGEILDLPQWGGKLILLMLGVGFILALFLAWAYELTPEGLKRESEVDRSQSITPKTGRKLDFAIIALLAVGLVYFIYEARFMKHDHAAEIAASASGPEASSTERPSAKENAETAAAPEPRGDQRTSIVVLPFVNMSADPEQEYFSDGLSEEILNALAQIEGLRVISRTSAFAFKGKDVAIPEIARQLDVSHVLEGSVRSAGDDVRITAQLIEVNTDSHLWSQAFSRKLENVFDIQLEISRAIADQLQLRLAGSETQKPTNNLDAYRLYLQGRQLYQTRHSDALRRSIELLERAVDLDPEFDEAWANLAAASSVYAFQLDDGYREYQQRSRDAARRAIAINPDNGLARAVNGLAQISEIRVIEGIPELQRAIALNPNESNALLWMGIALSVLGYTQEAIDALRAAEAVDPVFVNLQNWLAYLHWQSGDAEGALRHEARARELNPDFPMNIPGEQYFFSGDLDAAERAWERSNSYYADALGESFVDINRISRLMFEALKNPALRDEAVREIQALAPRSSFNGVFIPLMRLGAVEEAMDSIRQTVADGRGLRAMNTLGSVWLAYDRKHLSHPAVMALFEELGFVDYWRAHGAPDLCRPAGNGFQCGEMP